VRGGGEASKLVNLELSVGFLSPSGSSQTHTHTHTHRHVSADRRVLRICGVSTRYSYTSIGRQGVGQGQG